MTGKQKELLSKRCYTEFLMSLEVSEEGKDYILPMGTARALESIRAVGWRINARGESDRRFEFKASYPSKTLLVKVFPREDKSNQ